MAFKLPEVFTQGNLLSSHSKIRQSHKEHPISKEKMIYFEVNVKNGFVVPTPLPFGVFAETTEISSNEAQLQVWVANGFYQNNPTFAENRKRVYNLTPFIQEADVFEQIVLSGAPIITDTDTWEANQTAIDQTHDFSRKVQVVTRNDIVSGERDLQMFETHTITKTLEKAVDAEAAADFPAALSAGTPPNFNYIEYNEIRYGWYIKSNEEISEGTKTAFWTTRSQFWPAVLENIDLGILEGQLDSGETYIASVLIDARYKESYSGPCKTLVTKKWSSDMPEIVNPTQLVTDAFQYQGIFFNFTCPECLHHTVDFKEFTGSFHPKLKSSQFRIKSFPGTRYVDWPSFQERTDDPTPYKGGYLYDVIRIFAPQK